MKMNSDYKSTDVIDLNVGGVHYTTTFHTLTKHPDCRLAKLLQRSNSKTKKEGEKPPEKRIMHNGRIFIDRDGSLFRFILDYLRSDDKKLFLPEVFHELDRLREEAEYFQLPDLVKFLQNPRSAAVSSRITASRPSAQKLNSNGLSSSIGHALPGISRAPNGDSIIWSRVHSSTITVGYRGTFAFGRGDGASDIKFRKLFRILIAGRVSICREVFQDTLNESRDPDRGDDDRYTSRFFLKHCYLERAFDMLSESGFSMVGAVSSGASGGGGGDAKAASMDTEETKWLHYTEYIFSRK